MKRFCNRKDCEEELVFSKEEGLWGCLTHDSNLFDMSYYLSKETMERHAKAFSKLNEVVCSE